MKLSLKDYKKLNNKNDHMVVVSITVTQDQKRFIDSQGVNFSKLVRDVIEKLQIEENKIK